MVDVVSINMSREDGKEGNSIKGKKKPRIFFDEISTLPIISDNRWRHLFPLKFSFQ